ncbi:hypothetical protein KBB96_10030 [Luteolibacter ambystomatis]|uniref:Uncharacterized protein n=2 Tax=Luteolibacter ambystomatis TaxID=2824561 RepID=A0A975J365_9BACT|nr:hypothetical protein [Luteolibacter ambystomatis]QUE53218.1 hypothetical protein KBB96_10030 [Luteolibacter ambystomatis]
MQHLVRSRNLAGSLAEVETYAGKCRQAGLASGTGLSDPETEFWLMCHREWKEDDPGVLWTMMRLFDQWIPRNPEEFAQEADF